MYFGVGYGMGALVGGRVYRTRGARAVYVCAAGVLAAGWAACSAAQLLLDATPWGRRWQALAQQHGGSAQVELGEQQQQQVQQQP